jgi:hypothetical protein
VPFEPEKKFSAGGSIFQKGGIFPRKSDGGWLRILNFGLQAKNRARSWARPRQIPVHVALASRIDYPLSLILRSHPCPQNPQSPISNPQ